MNEWLKSFDWFGLAPYGAGSPPAFVLAINLYDSVMTVVQPNPWGLGALVAGLGIIGMMAVEIGTYKMLARAFADKEWRAAGLAFVGACIVTGLIVFSVYSGADTRALFSSTVVMLVGYLAIMVCEFLERKKTNVLTAEELRIREMNAARLLQNSQNRGAKLSGVSAGQRPCPLDRLDNLTRLSCKSPALTFRLILARPLVTGCAIRRARSSRQLQQAHTRNR